MKNLKKVLALVMAFAMAFTMMASAAYTDQADITATEAVDTLAALNVMTGNPDGSFAPNKTVTRAEMCRMIFSIRSGGNSDASAYTSMQTTFTDVPDDAWYAGYVKYCQSVGIVSGTSKTTFEPNRDVTGIEAALMCLRVMGYDPAKANIGGSTWSITTIGLATENGLLDDVKSEISKGLPRQYAAQIMYNMIDASTVKWSTDSDSYSNVGSDNTPNETVGHKYMDLLKTTGTLESVTKPDGKNTYNLSVDNVDDANSDVGYKNYAESFTDVKADYSALKYKKVKVLYKKSNEVYGVFATSDNTSNTGVLADLKVDGEKIKLDGTKYSLNKDGTTVYVDGQKQAEGIFDWVKANAEGNKTNEKGSKVELLATDGSTNIAILNVTTYKVAKVTYVGSDYLTADGKKSNDDYNYSSDIKKDDYVAISASGNYADGKGKIEKADIVEGKIDSTKTSSGDINKVQIDGNWYSTNAAKTGDSALKLGSSVKLVLVNGYIYDITKVTTSASDIALLVDAGKTSGVSSKYEARLIFADGTDKVVEIKKYWDDNSKNGEVSQAIDATPTLVTFDVSKDTYTLTKITEADPAGYDKYVEATKATVDGSVKDATFSDSKVSKLYFESTGVVFVRQDAGDDNDDPEFKVVTGKTAANWDLKESLNNTLTVKAVADESNSNLYAQVAVVDFGGNKTTGSTDKTYAVALDASYTAKEGGTTYTMVNAWNGTEEKLYKYDGTISGGIAAGTIFEYSQDTEDTVDITVCETVTDKVVAYDEGTGDIDLEKALATGCKSKIDSKDTVVLYVDSDAGKGVESGEIRQANKYNDSADDDVINVAVFSEKNEDQITVLVVDVNNDYTQW